MMFKKFTHTAVGALGVGSLMLVGMGPATAALTYLTSETYDTVSCNTYEATEYCHESAGKRSGHGNSAGRGLSKDKYERTYTTAVDGEVVREQQFSGKEVTVWDIPWGQVFHTVEKGTITTPEGQCRYHSVSHSSNSEVRANNYRTQCDY